MKDLTILFLFQVPIYWKSLLNRSKAKMLFSDQITFGWVCSGIPGYARICLDLQRVPLFNLGGIIRLKVIQNKKLVLNETKVFFPTICHTQFQGIDQIVLLFNDIAAFFDHQYFWKETSSILDLLHGDSYPVNVTCKITTFAKVWPGIPNHIQACLSLSEDDFDCFGVSMVIFKKCSKWKIDQMVRRLKFFSLDFLHKLLSY